MNHDAHAAVQAVNREFFSLLENHFPEERKSLAKCESEQEIRPITLKTIQDRTLILSPAGRAATSPAIYKLELLLNEIVDFWRIKIDQHLRNVSALDSMLVSTLADPNELAGVRAFGIYFDFVLVNEPLLMQWNTLMHMSNVSLPQFGYTTLNYYFHLLFHKSLFCGANCPPAILLPRRNFLDETMEDQILNCTAADACDAFSLITDVALPTKESVIEFLGRTPARGVIRNRKAWNTIMESQSRLLRLDKNAEFGAFLSLSARRHYGTVGENLSLDPLTAYGSIATIMRQIVLLTADSMEFDADPVVPNGISSAFCWKARAESMKAASTLQRHVSEEHLFTSAIQTEIFPWLLTLDNVESERLRSERETVREIFSASRRRVKLAEVGELDVALQGYGKAVMDRIKSHDAVILQVRSERRKQLKRGAISFLMASGLTIASTALPPLGIPAAILSILLGGKSVKDLTESYRAGNREAELLRRRPIAILFEASKRHAR